MILVATGMQREARIIARPGVIVVAGGGDDAWLEAELDARANGTRALLSIGVAGALAEDLRPGDWVIGTGPLGARLATILPHARIGPIYADGRMVADATAKQALHAATGAIAVDMESHIAARVAARHHLPFAIIRVISDAASDDLPAAARVALRPGGGIAIGAVLASLIRHPAQLPALIRTGRDAGIAMRSLFRGYDMLARFGFGLADEGQFPLDMA